MILKREAIFTPQANELLVVRGVMDNRTVNWAVSVGSVKWAPGSGPYELRLAGRVIGADFNDAIDERIDNQKASINRLTEHLRHHCPDLRMELGTLFARCDWEESVAP